MRTLFFLLALANLLFFVYAQGYFGRPENPDAVRLEKQVQADGLKVVARGEPPPAPARPAETPVAPEGEAAKTDAHAPNAELSKEAAKASEVARDDSKEQLVCVAWQSLSSSEADRLSALLTEKFDDFRQSRKVMPAEGGAWWVFIPSQTSKADADKKAAELKKLGIEDFFVIQDTGPNRWAISLGVFSAEAGANTRLNQLRSKGVKSAKAGPRNTKDVLQALEARGPAARQSTLLAAVAEVMTAQSQACK
ncbi:MAG TPA: SPOR domain-containing protein [Rhodocyclaceae bacterium]|nr:SPOR domain-containing protein [Rhodocyclaceae bacterium]